MRQQPNLMCWLGHRRRWNEYRALRQLHFDYAERQAPLSLARSLASELQLVSAEDVLLALHGVPQVASVGKQNSLLFEGCA